MGIIKKIASQEWLVVAAIGISLFLGYQWYKNYKAEKAANTETAAG